VDRCPLPRPATSGPRTIARPRPGRAGRVVARGAGQRTEQRDVVMIEEGSEPAGEPGHRRGTVTLDAAERAARPSHHQHATSLVRHRPDLWLKIVMIVSHGTRTFLDRAAIVWRWCVRPTRCCPCVACG